MNTSMFGSRTSRRALAILPVLVGQSWADGSDAYAEREDEEPRRRIRRVARRGLGALWVGRASCTFENPRRTRLYRRVLRARASR